MTDAGARVSDRPLDTWFAERRKLVLALTLAIAVLLRVFAFAELNAGPLLHLHEWSESDMSFFHAWGEELAGGDWLTDRALHPHHGWHAADAEEHFAAHPDDAAVLAAEAGREGRGRTPGELLWDRWYGGKRFHQEPLYAYLVGATYAVFGPEPRWVFAWQCVLGVLSVLLVRRLARRSFGAAAGGIAGLLAALYAPLVAYDFLLLRATPLTFVSLLLAWLATVALDRGTSRAWFVTGLVAGLALLLKLTFALFVAGLVLWLAWTQRARLSLALRPLAALGAGVLLALAPAIARNVAVGVPATSLSSVGAVGILSANAEDTAGRPELSLGSRHLPRIFADTDRGLSTVFVEALKTHDNLGRYALALGARALWIWHGYEIPNNANVELFRLQSSALRVAFVSFALIAPLGLVGSWLARRRGSAVALALMALSNVPALIVFGILSRYRTPMAAALLPFAALAVVNLVEWVRARELAQAAFPLALVLASVVAARVHPPQRVRVTDYLVPLQVYYQPRIQAAVERADWPAAAELAGRAAGLEPCELLALGPERAARTERERTLARAFAEVHAVHARFLRNAGRASEADEAERRAARLADAAGG